MNMNEPQKQKFKTKLLKTLFLRELNNNKINLLELKGLTSYDQDNHNAEMDLFSKEYKIKFMSVEKRIRSKSFLSSMNSLLHKLYRYLNCNINTQKTTTESVIAFQLGPREFTSAFVIYGFPEIILDIDREKLKTKDFGIYSDIYYFAEDLINQLMEILEEDCVIDNNIFRKFVKTVNMYSNCFANYVTVDKDKKMKELMMGWYGFKKSIRDIENNNKLSDDQKKECIEVIDKNKKSTLDMLCRMNRHIRPEAFEEYMNKYETLMDNFEEQFKKAYWDQIVDELNKGNNELLIKVLLEIKDELVKLVPNNHTYHEELNEYFDIDFTKQKIETGVYNYNELIGQADYLVNVILRLQSPIRNNDTRNKWESLKELFNNKDPNDITWGFLLPPILSLVLDEIKVIKSDIKLLTQQ